MEPGLEGFHEFCVDEVRRLCRRSDPPEDDVRHICAIMLICWRIERLLAAQPVVPFDQFATNLVEKTMRGADPPRFPKRKVRELRSTLKEWLAFLQKREREYLDSRRAQQLAAATPANERPI